MKILLAIVILFATYSSGWAQPAVIATFNVDLSNGTINDSFRVRNIVNILSKYDLIFLQGIENTITQKIFQRRIIARLNKDLNGLYKFIMSESFSERSAYIYNSNVFQIISKYQSEDSFYERPPLAVNFRHTESDNTFVIIGVHVKFCTHRTCDQCTINELNKLVKTYDDVVNIFGVVNALIMGNLNADCDCVKKSDWSSLKLWTNSTFHWLNKKEHTNLAKIPCIYDRIIMTDGFFNGHKAWAATDFSTGTVSEHYPVYAIIDFSPKKLNILTIILSIFVISSFVGMTIIMIAPIIPRKSRNRYTDISVDSNYWYQEIPDEPAQLLDIEHKI